MISIILVEPKNSGNVGAIARAMANFGFDSLVLVNPRCNHLSQTARNRAKWAQKVLQKAKVVTVSELATYKIMNSTIVLFAESSLAKVEQMFGIQE